MPETDTPASTKTPPRWRRLLAWVWAKEKALAVWVWTKIRSAAQRVWTEVRNQDNTRPKRALWAVGGVAGAGALATFTGTVALIGYAILLWPFTPSVSTLRDAREIYPSTVVSADGVELTRYARRNREWRTLDEISPHVVEALVATEDRRFHTHRGVDLIGWAAVGKDVVTGNGLRGASTITQQLARNLFPDRIGNAASITRKLREAITALKIEGVYTKDEILELYLNTVPFLYNAHGIEMAARTYFSTDAGSLDRLQAATLVGMLKGTYSYNPYRRPERALARRNVVLGQMVKYSALDPDEAAQLADQPLGLQFERQPMMRSRAPHFTEHVRVMLEAWADDEGYSLYGDGLTIHTTLDWRMQQRAQESARRFGDALQSVADVEWGRASASRLGTTTAPYVTASRTTEPFERFWSLRSDAANAFVRDTRAYRRALERGQDPDVALDSLLAVPAFRDSVRQVKMRVEVALTAVDPETGQVKAWVGSRDYQRSAYDHVARMRRQPGSTFKPFLYARALEEGWRPDDTLPDDSVSIEMSDGVVWQPTNAGGISGREITLREALATSKNTVSAQLVDDVGPRDLARTARRLGVESRLDAVPALALGTSEVSLLEMASAYASIAAGGVRRPPVVVTYITDRDGNEVARFEEQERRALDPEVSVQLLDMMRGVVDGGTGRQIRSAFNGSGDLAGKTGTTQDGADGWFLLMRPDLVTGAWVGFDDPRVTFRSSYWGQGGHNALRVVGDLNRTLQRDGLVSTRLAFPSPPEEIRGPSLWGRFTTWVGGVTDDLFEREPDVPDDYGPRTPGRRWDPEAPPAPERPGVLERLAGEVLTANARWLEKAIYDLAEIDDPRVREAAREILEEAVTDLRRDGRQDGWAERVRDARDRAIAEAARQIEREEAAVAREIEEALRDEAERRGLFDDEVGASREEVTPIEEVPVEPEEPASPPRRDGAPAGAGRIEW
ncbi:MAG: transglycosylase domain-containing protein [Bacteroidota bacterium]